METKALREIGLSENEVKVYLSLLKKGPCLASDVAYDSRLNRTLVYDLIEKLIEKGMANYVIRENRKYFNASSPRNILEYIEERKRSLDLKRDEIESLIPLMENLKKNDEEVVVEVFKGTEGAKTVFNHVIEVGETLRVFPWIGAFYERMPVFYRNYLKRIKERKIHREIITAEEKKSLISDEEPLVKVRYLPSYFDIPSSTWLYGNYVVICIQAEEITLVRIKSKTAAEANNRFFEGLWKIAKK